jgi:hypothetical protein
MSLKLTALLRAITLERGLEKCIGSDQVVVKIDKRDA